MNRDSLRLITSMLLVSSNVGIGKSIVEFILVPLLARLRFVMAMMVFWPLLRIAKLRPVPGAIACYKLAVPLALAAHQEPLPA